MMNGVLMLVLSMLALSFAILSVTFARQFGCYQRYRALMCGGAAGLLGSVVLSGVSGYLSCFCLGLAAILTSLALSIRYRAGIQISEARVLLKAARDSASPGDCQLMNFLAKCEHALGVAEYDYQNRCYAKAELLALRVERGLKAIEPGISCL